MSHVSVAFVGNELSACVEAIGPALNLYFHVPMNDTLDEDSLRQSFATFSGVFSRCIYW
jgi:hypothetical protein